MIGTIINVIAVIIGSIIGLITGKFYNDEMRDITIKGIGLVTLVLGFQMALMTRIPIEASDFLIIIFSMVLGGITGVILKIEERLESTATWLKEKTNNKESTFVEGFVVATIIFETGPMAVLGAINDGMSGNIDLLLTKSALDGFVSIAFASSMGTGVLFSSLSVLIYQGLITLASSILAPLIPLYTEQLIGILGGVLILGIGLKLLDIQDVKVANFMPAIIWVVILSLLVSNLPNFTF